MGLSISSEGKISQRMEATAEKALFLDLASQASLTTGPTTYPLSLTSWTEQVNEIKMRRFLR